MPVLGRLIILCPVDSFLCLLDEQDPYPPAVGDVLRLLLFWGFCTAADPRRASEEPDRDKRVLLGFYAAGCGGTLMILGSR